MMRKSSKIVSLLLAVLMAASCITGLSFASVAAAEDPTINFRVPSDWTDAGEIKAVYCHIYSVYGDDDYIEVAWSNKNEKANYDAAKGIATFNDVEIFSKKGELVRRPIKDECDYGVLFHCVYSDKAIAPKQTGNVSLSTECYGGTIYVTGNLTENTEDSSKMDAEARWEEASLDAKYGPLLGITSTGKIVNDYLPIHRPKAQPIAQFIGNYAKSKVNSKYVTPENIQGMMNDDRFQVTAQEVLDEYNALYAEKLAEEAELAEADRTLATIEEVKVLTGYVEEAPTTEAPTTEAPTTEAPTTEAPTTEAPTTEAPTTEAPTTEAPTTEAPTTEAPTTEAPTTVPTTQFGTLVYGDVNMDGNINIDDATLVQKAGINLITLTEQQSSLANVNPEEDKIVNIIDVTYIQKWLAGIYKNTAFVGNEYKEQADTYVVAGSEEVFGVNWDGFAEANQMTLVDGVYVLTISNVAPIEQAQFKIVKNGADWIGDPTGNNFTFKVEKACDVTITFDPATNEAKVEGDGVVPVDFNLESVRAVGNGGSGFLNDVEWDPAADENLLTEVSDGVYQLVMTDVEGNGNAEFKFAANGNWNDSWGGTFAGFDVETEAVYNGENLVMAIGEGDADENLYTVTLTLDLSAFDYATKQGAKFTVSQKVQGDEPSTTEEVPTTTEEVPTTTEEVPTTTEEVPTTEPVPAKTYVVAGSEEVFGVKWDFNAETASSNVMTEVDGVYTLTIQDVPEFTNAQFKIGTNGIDGTDCIGKGADGAVSTAPDAFNFAFNVTAPCDVTITYNPATNEVTYTGEFVTEYVFTVDSIRVVGNGGSGYLNDVAWDPAADENLMEEIAPGVYQIVMVDVEYYPNAQLKFAADGSWGTNWGGTFAGFDVETDAVYNAADNITFDIGEDDDNYYTVTVTLDLSGFDPATNSGAKFTISQEVQGDEPDPTEEVPTTTEEVPTTTEEVPTTTEEVPTTKPEDPTPSTDTYIVAGSEEVFGVNWDGTEVANLMTFENGVYKLTLTNVAPIEQAQFKIVKNGTEWIGDATGNNFTFMVETACDVTITYDPATGEAKAEGDGIGTVTFNLESVRAVGNGGSGFLNDVEWDPADDANLLTEVSDGVYQLVMTDVEGNGNAEFKFAANGNWNDSWGGTFAGFDVETEAVYNGENLVMAIGEGDADENLYTVTLTLDLSAFDYATKQGAKFTISQAVQA